MPNIRLGTKPVATPGIVSPIKIVRRLTLRKHNLCIQHHMHFHHKIKRDTPLENEIENV